MMHLGYNQLYGFLELYVLFEVLYLGRNVLCIHRKSSTKEGLCFAAVALAAAAHADTTGEPAVVAASTTMTAIITKLVFFIMYVDHKIS
jgi:hypothetical protein